MVTENVAPRDRFPPRIGADASTDPLPRIMAGRVVGIDEAMVEAIGRSTRDWEQVLALGEQQLLGAPSGRIQKKR